MSDNFVDLIRNYLADPEEAALYLDAVVEANDPKTLLVALKNVVDAQGGMTSLSDKTGLARESLYRSLKEEGNPKFETFNKIINSLGLRLSVVPLDSTNFDSMDLRYVRSETGETTDIDPVPPNIGALQYYMEEDCKPYHVS